MSDASGLLEAAKNLRAAQRAYLADRGNDTLGRAVASAAAELDEWISLHDSPAAPASLAGGRPIDALRELNEHYARQVGHPTFCACFGCTDFTEKLARYAASVRAPRAEPGAGSDERATERRAIEAARQVLNPLTESKVGDLTLADLKRVVRAALAATREGGSRERCAVCGGSGEMHGAECPGCEGSGAEPAPTPQPAGAEPGVSLARDDLARAVMNYSAAHEHHVRDYGKPLPHSETLREWGGVERAIAAYTAAVNKAVSVNTRPAPAPAVEEARKALEAYNALPVNSDERDPWRFGELLDAYERALLTQTGEEGQ